MGGALGTKLGWKYNILINQNNIHPLLIFVSRLILGFVFIYASYEKILEPEGFAKNINNYHIIPFGLENSIAIFLPWLELFIGLGLIFGIFIKGSAMIGGGLLCLFIILILQAMLRGFNIECGCGLKEGEMVGWSKILENSILLFASYLVYVSKNRIFEIFPKSSLSE